MRPKTSSITLSLAGIALAGILAISSPSFAAPSATEPAVVTEVEGGSTKVIHKESLEKTIVHQEEGKDPSESELRTWMGTMISTILVFLGLFVVLRLTAWKPIMTGLKNRELAIRSSIEAAQKAKADAERTTHELEAKMAEVQRQAAQQLNQAKADAVKIADGIRAQAEAESAALKDRTLREIDAAKQQALGEINNHAAILGTAVARKILQRQVNADDQQRLVEESLTELAKKN